LGGLSSFLCWLFVLGCKNNKQDGENHMQTFEEYLRASAHNYGQTTAQVEKSILLIFCP